MSLVRLAFWLALLVMLLPTDAQQQARFTEFANSALGRATTFCDRNGKSCNAAAEAWGTFLKKAEFGIRLVSDLLGAGGRQTAQGPDQGLGQNLGQSLGKGQDYDPEPPPPAAKRLGKVDPRGTLSPPDVYRPPWRGPARPDRN